MVQGKGVSYSVPETRGAQRVPKTPAHHTEEVLPVLSFQGQASHAGTRSRGAVAVMTASL